MGANKVISISIIFLSTMTLVWAQNRKFVPKYSNVVDQSLYFQDNFKDSLALWPERVMLQIANEYPKVGEPIFFKAYLSMGKQQRKNGNSKVLNVDVLDSKGVLIKRQLHKIVDGLVHGQLELSNNCGPGEYSIRAYTRWSLNYGSHFAAWEKIQIGSLENKKGMNKISVLPEGGTLLCGYENRIIVKIPESLYHKSAGIVRVVDGDKKEVAKVHFYLPGLGTAIYKPIKGRVYQMELGDGSLFPIPSAESEGYLLHVNNLKEDHAKIRVIASTGTLGTELTLVGEIGGIPYFEKKLNFQKDNVLDLELSKTNFPQGIFTLKLVDPLGSELARRPIWMDGKRLRMEIGPSGQEREPGTRAYIVKVTDPDGFPMKSQLALSVNRFEPDTEMNHIATRLDRGNFFPFPGIRDRNKTITDRENSFTKDLVLQASVDDLKKVALVDGDSGHLKFPFQKGLELIGHAYDLNNTLLANTKIQVMATGLEDLWFGESQTDAQGKLKLLDIHISGKASLIARTKGDDTKSRLVKIIPMDPLDQMLHMPLPPKTQKPGQKDNGQPDISGSSDIGPIEGLIHLEEVEVLEKEFKRKKYTPSLYGVNIPSHLVVHQDFDFPKSLTQLLSELPGVIVSGAESFVPTVRVHGGNGPVLWVLDGFPLSQEGGGTHMGTSAQNSMDKIMALVNYRDIERVELLKGPEASMYGTRASGGVLIIYTRSGSELEYIQRKEAALEFEGYTDAHDFKSYMEKLSRKKGNQNNLLYWNPKLETDENGEAVIIFAVPPDASNIKIQASTISSDGKIGAFSEIFQ